MVSSRTATWTVVVFELVLSCTAFIASLAIICAQLQSTSEYEERKSPRFYIISLSYSSFFLFSFLLILATIMAMFGLSGRRSAMIIPHILLMVSSFLL
uniref:MARVEL domain-containing protein n=1 Tax=Ascaris lumbricoides TaxID=6252 RepID=A0A0M3HKQ8_ASCLU